MRKLILIPMGCMLLCVPCAGVLRAQQLEALPLASGQYLFDNPAAAGADGQHHLFIGAYKKWLGVADAPTTLYLSSTHPLAGRSLGGGLLLLHDRAGLIRHTRASLFASVHTPAGRTHQLALGAAAQIQFFQFGTPNVTDLIPSELAENNLIALGASLNYHLRLAPDDKSFLNVMAYYPQIARRLLLYPETDDISLGYQPSQYFMLQANFHYAVSDQVVLQPALRWQQQRGNDPAQLLDLSLGASFGNDAFTVRGGFRAGHAASALYAGLGLRLGPRSDIRATVEPLGPLGPSLATDISMAWGNKTPPPPSRPAWQYQDTVQQWLRRERVGPVSLADVFAVTVFNDPPRSVLTYSLEEGVDSYVDLLAEPNFLVQVPLDSLIEHISQVITRVSRTGAQIKKIEYVAIARTQQALSNSSGETYQGKPLALSYIRGNGATARASLLQGSSMNYEVLAAAKLHFIAQGMEKRMPVLAAIPKTLVVEQEDANLDDRKILIHITLQARSN